MSNENNSNLSPEAKAKAAAAAKAKAAAAAAAKAAAATTAEAETEAPEAPKAPNPNQPLLDKILKVVTNQLGPDVIEEAFINEMSENIPTLVIKNGAFHDVAKVMKEHPELAYDYMGLSLGVDQETFMESVNYLYSYKHRNQACMKVKVDREKPTVASVTDLWAGADWFERETYDLLGIEYVGHPNLKRILLSDDWVGYPLRKDYVQYDEEG